MRQMRTQGWMHNRVRMVVASFLVKELLINWKEGERIFSKYLIDGDLGSNNAGEPTFRPSRFLLTYTPSIIFLRLAMVSKHRYRSAAVLQGIQPHYPVGEVRPRRGLHPILRARAQERQGQR